MKIRLNHIGIIAAALTLLFPQAGRASSSEYSLNRVLNVALLRVPSVVSGDANDYNQSGSAPTPGSLVAPYIFDILNNRTDVKPVLWKLENPLAPSIVDAEVSSRYTFAGQTSSLYPIGTQLTSNMAPYWEVDLSKISTGEQLASFNLLVICTNSPQLGLTISERQILRQYVDQGGTLWIEGPTGSNLSLADTNLFRVTPSLALAGTAVPSYHPIVTSPYAVNINNLGVGTANSGIIAADTGGVPDPTLFQSVDGSIVAGDYGSGHVIVDDQGICESINAEGAAGSIVTANVPSASNFSQYDSASYTTTPEIDLQFLVDVLTYATSSQTSGANDRGNGVQGGNISGALDASWQYAVPSDNPVGIATYGKFVYTTDSLGNLTCLDVNPPESIYPDANNGDDGLTDYAGGTSYDVIWTVKPSGINVPLSVPVVASMPCNGGNTTVVMVQDNDGNVYGYNATADPGTAGIPAKLFSLPASGNSIFTTSGAIVPGPTYYRGQVLVPQPPPGSGTSSSVEIYQGTFSGNMTAYATIPDIGNGGGWAGPISVASIPSTDNNGYNGDEIVGYAVTTTGIQTFELGSRDEQLKPTGSGVTSSSSTYWTHLNSIDGGDFAFPAPEDGPVGGSNWILDFNSDNETNGFPTQSAFAYTAASPSPLNAVVVGVGNDDTAIYGDFNINPAQSAPLRTAIPADPNGGSGDTISGAAVGPDDLIYVTVNGPVAGTSYIEAINEQADVADTSSAIKWRFLLDGHTVTGQPDSVVDADGINYDFQNFRFVGAPVVGSNGVVYALAIDRNDGITRLMAFNTTPTTGFAANGLFAVSQVNEFGATEAISGSQMNNEIFTNYTNETGSLQANLFAPGTLMIQPEQNENGTIVATGPPYPVQTDTAVNGAEPMLEWYTQFPKVIGSAATQQILATSPPQMVGDYIYFGIATSTSGGGTLYSTAAVLANPARIGLLPDPYTRLINIDSDYRFVQNTPSSVGQVTIPPVGTDKYLITGGVDTVVTGGISSEAGGFEGLSYNSILVADGNRIVQFDPSGNAVWTLDSTEQSSQAATYNSGTGAFVGAATGAETTVQFNRPATVTQLTPNDYLIADTGNSRCVQVDRSGNVLTSLTDSNGYVLYSQLVNAGALLPSTASLNPYSFEISSFSDPLGIVPAGQPLTLNRPNSVTTWLVYEFGNGTTNLPTNIEAHYLIADTGNDRVVDVVDRYTEVGQTNVYGLLENVVNGTPTGTSLDYHYIDWISHTTDVGGRAYQYTGAVPIPDAQAITNYTAVYPDSTAPVSDTVIGQAVGIIATVGDKYIPALASYNTAAFPTPSNLTAQNQDGAGSSILLLNYSSGYPYTASSGVGGYESGLPTQLINSVAYDTAPSTLAVLPLRGVRSVIPTFYSVNQPSMLGFIVADDDGVFDGHFTGALGTTNPTNLTVSTPTISPYLLDATYGTTTLGWAFMTADYQNMVTQYNNLLDGFSGTNTSNAYAGTPFLPASAIELAGNNYLIVNRGSVGNQNTPVLNGGTNPGFGGNVFTVHANKTATNPPIDTLDGLIIGQPANTGALSAPAFALRSQ